MKIEDFCDTKNEQIKTTNVRSAGKRKKAKLHGILPLVWRRHRSYLQVIMTPEDLFKRLRDLAYNIVKLCGDLPPGNLSRIITFQILKSSFSAAANYRAACRGQSPKSFISKLSISFEESDETQFWLESIYDLEMLPPERVKPLLTEAAELASILGRSRKTAETNMKTAARKRSRKS